MFFTFGAVSVICFFRLLFWPYWVHNQNPALDLHDLLTLSHTFSDGFIFKFNKGNAVGNKAADLAVITSIHCIQSHTTKLHHHIQSIFSTFVNIAYMRNRRNSHPLSGCSPPPGNLTVTALWKLFRMSSFVELNGTFLRNKHLASLAATIKKKNNLKSTSISIQTCNSYNYSS